MTRGSAAKLTLLLPPANEMREGGEARERSNTFSKGLKGLLRSDRAFQVRMPRSRKVRAWWTDLGMAMQDYGLGLRVGLKDLPILRTRLN